MIQEGRLTSCANDVFTPRKDEMTRRHAIAGLFLAGETEKAGQKLSNHSARQPPGNVCLWSVLHSSSKWGLSVSQPSSVMSRY